MSSTIQQHSKNNYMHRSEQILSCQEQIRVLRQQLQHHKRAWKVQYTQTALRRIGTDAWFELTLKEQKNKTNLLILLENTHDTLLPHSLLGNEFWSTLPQQLRDDRDLLLARLQRPLFARELGTSLFVLPASLKGDVEMVGAAVQAYPPLLLDWHDDPLMESYYENPQVLQALFRAESFEKREQYLRLFSVTLRSDSNLMLEALKHGIRALDVLPKQLRHSRSFALQAATILKDSKLYSGAKCLKSFSMRLKSDFNVVQAFCECDGTSLAVASYTARRNSEIVRAACRQEPTALLYCLKGSTRTKLIQDKTFWIELLEQAPVQCPCAFFQFLVDMFGNRGHVESWDRLVEIMPIPVRTDPEIALLMLQKAPSTCRYVEEIPLSLLTDHAFLLKVAALERLQSLPVSEYLDDGLIPDVNLEFCCAIVSHSYVCTEVIETIVNQYLPDYPNYRQFWVAFHPKQLEETLDYLFENIPEDIFNDREIMLKFAACEESASYVASILWETDLAEDRDVLSALLKIHPEALAQMPNYIQELYPDLVVLCIENLPSDSDLLEDLHDAIDEDLWIHRDVAMAWIRKGGEDIFFLEDFFEDDEEIFLAVAEHNWDDFHMASESLLENKEFLIKAVSRNGRVWTILEDEAMKEDFDIALAAFAADPNLPYYSADEAFQFLATFARKVRNELEIHDSFVQLVLCSMDLAASSSSNLFAKLNQGRHTAQQYKKNIAEYIGLPVGDRLVQLRKKLIFLTTLERFGFRIVDRLSKAPVREALYNRLWRLSKQKS